MNPPRTASLLVDSRCTLGEGILWWAERGAVVWTDIDGARLWMHARDEGVTRSWRLPDRLGSMAICESGRLLLGLAKGLFTSDLPAGDSDSFPVTPLVSFEAALPTRVNDGRTDRSGNFVFGTYNEEHTEPKARIGSFYQYSRRHGLRRINLDPAAIPNSICFSPDGHTMYFCDSPRRRIMQGDYDAEAASVTRVRLFADLTSSAGFPDGSIVDADGHLWNAEWGSAAVRRYTPVGTLDREVTVPARNPSCVALGGPDLDELYVTTARQDLSPEDLDAHPEAGGVYVLRSTGVRGLVDAPFRDL